jgi:hypothetical protein
MSVELWEQLDYDELDAVCSNLEDCKCQEVGALKQRFQEQVISENIHRNEADSRIDMLDSIIHISQTNLSQIMTEV